MGNQCACRLFFASCILLSLLSRVLCAKRPCVKSDYRYEYTPCDSFGGRWRVEVPKDPGVCEPRDVDPPIRGKNCSFSCEEGEYLDPQRQICLTCPAGTFSIGDGKRYDEWLIPNHKGDAHLPLGFDISDRPAALAPLYMRGSGGGQSSGAVLSDHDLLEKLTNCSNSGWKAESRYLFYQPGYCESILSFSVELVRPGVLEYEYLYPSEDLIFTFNIQDEQCLASDISFFSSNNKFRYNRNPPTTQQGRPNIEKVNLDKGRTVLSWKAMVPPIVGGTGQVPIVILSMQITGLGYTSECSLCPAGTFSSENARLCTHCAADTFADKRGSTQCQPCGKNEYSGERAIECRERPPCTDLDMYQEQTPCEGGQTTISYSWVKPKVCNTQHKMSTVRSLPAQRKQPCPPCNPGQHKGKSGKCEFCPKNKHSSEDGKSCKRCPADSTPNYAYQYISWNQLPSNMVMSCERDDVTKSSAEDLCSGQAWHLADDRIHTSPTRRSDVYFVLKLEAKHGFSNALRTGDVSVSNPIGHVQFVFDTDCSSEDCSFYFLQTDRINDAQDKWNIVAMWNGTQTHKVYRSAIVSPNPTVFIWVFVRSRLSDDAYLSDTATVRQINVTHAADGGADACLPCPTQGRRGCSACPPGHYVGEVANSARHKCVRCPTDTYLNTSSDRQGVDSCLPCGPGLTSADGVACRTDCRYSFNDTATNIVHSYDFAKLKGSYSVKGVPIFGREGSMYYHLFNLSVCMPDAPVTCYNNFSSIHGVMPSKVAGQITSLLCRETVMPPLSAEETIYYSNAFSIADNLVAITSDRSHDRMHVNDEFGKEQGVYKDVHFYYAGNSPTATCPFGRGAIVTMRCDPKNNKTEVKIPPKCPDGTCDGCTYSVLLTSRLACPTCTAAEYARIEGACHAGRRTVHYIPPAHCDARPAVHEHCNPFSNDVLFILSLCALMAIALIAILCHVCRKNKKLEYKYHKLVASAQGGGKDGELPAAETCGLESDDEDEDNDSDSVSFRKGGKPSRGGAGKRFLGRLRDKTGRQNDFMDQPVLALDTDEM